MAVDRKSNLFNEMFVLPVSVFLSSLSNSELQKVTDAIAVPFQPCPLVMILMDLLLKHIQDSISRALEAPQYLLIH